MELDELKKKWNAVDEHLQKQTVTSDEQIANLLARHKANAHKSLGRITKIQRLSVTIGLIILVILAIAFMLITPLFTTPDMQHKVIVFLIFMVSSILIGLWWDWKSYRWSNAIRVDEMSVTEVSRRMAVLRSWTRYEVAGICIWALLFNVLNYWIMDYHHKSIGAQLVLITVFILFDILIIYLFYKKVMYKHLNNINKNIEELQDICIE